MRALGDQRVRRWTPVAILLVAVVVVGIVTGTRPDEGLPLDPRSAGPNGTRAVFTMLERLDAPVEVLDRAELGAADVALVLVDNLDEPTRERLAGFARAGGTLIIADPSSPLTPDPAAPAGFGFIDPTLPRRCDVPAFGAAASVLAPGSATYEVGPGARGCYEQAGSHWLVLVPEGDGIIVALGGPSFLTNANLGAADNAVLAAALLAPGPQSHVVALRPDFAPPGGDRRSLEDLIPPRVGAALLQLAVAFVVVVLWRARRLGRPVEEPRQLELAGSELVVAVGNLLQRSGSRRQAAQALRDDLRHSLSERFGLASRASTEEVADAVAARSDVSGKELRAVLGGSGDLTEIELVELAQRVEAVRRAVDGAREPGVTRAH